MGKKGKAFERIYGFSCYRGGEGSSFVLWDAKESCTHRQRFYWCGTEATAEAVDTSALSKLTWGSYISVHELVLMEIQRFYIKITPNVEVVNALLLTSHSPQLKITVTAINQSYIYRFMAERKLNTQLGLGRPMAYCQSHQCSRIRLESTSNKLRGKSTG